MTWPQIHPETGVVVVRLCCESSYRPVKVLARLIEFIKPECPLYGVVLGIDHDLLPRLITRRKNSAHIPPWM